jgi:hypothetical protein
LLTRREFGEQFVGVGLTSWIVGRPSLSLPPAAYEVCDLLIKGGTVSDPLRNITRPLTSQSRTERFRKIARYSKKVCGAIGSRFLCWRLAVIN